MFTAPSCELKIKRYLKRTGSNTSMLPEDAIRQILIETAPRKSREAKVMRKLLWVFLPIILLGAGAKSSYACLCSFSLMSNKLLLLEGKLNHKAYLDNYDGVIFTGQVIKIKKVRVKLSSGDEWHNYRVTFKVDRYWKGSDNSEVVVFTGVGGGDCGIRFRNRESYIVFAHTFEDKLHTGICTFTADSRYVANIIKGLNLGEGRHPTQKARH